MENWLSGKTEWLSGKTDKENIGKEETRRMKSKKWLISLGLAVVLVVAFALPACEPVEPGPATRLNIGVGTLPGSLVMEQESLMYSHLGCLYLMIVYENLAGYPKVGEDLADASDFWPKLATAYDVDYEDDGAGGQNQVWTIDLRQGVKWHDFAESGKYFTADDVLYSIKYVQYTWGNDKPVNWTAVAANDWEILPEHMLVTKVNDYRVEFRYVEDYHQNEGFFPCAYLWYAFVPEHVFGPAGNGTQEGWNEDPLAWDGNYIGTGPYMVKEYVAASHLLLERFDDYWAAGDEGDPYWELPAAEEVLFQLYENEGPFWIAFEAGAMDSSASFSVPHPKKASYEADADITVEVVPDLSVYYLGFNLHETGGYAPLQEYALRQAIAAAVDKEDIIAITFGSYGEVADSFVYLESPNHHPSLPNNAYNLTEAASILTAANYTKDEGDWYTPWPEVAKIAFDIGVSGWYQDVGLMIVQDLQDFGLDVGLAVHDSTTYYDYLYDPAGGGMVAFVSAEDPSPDPWSDWIWMMLMDPEDWGLEWNPCWYYNPDYDDLCMQNYWTPNLTAEAKKEILWDMQEILAEDIPVVFLAREYLISAYRNDKWENWYNEMGGLVSWINEYSLREVTPVPVD